MKYGQIAGNNSINLMIYRCFGYIGDEDAPKFVKKFKALLKDEVQVMHTFRELVLGAYLALTGFNVRYEYAVGTQTPDWCVLDESSSPKAVFELTNFHLDKVTEDDIDAKLQTTGVWLHWQEPNDNRLYHSIQRKASTYKAMAERISVPYVVAVFGEFTAAVNLDELNQCLILS